MLGMAEFFTQLESYADLEASIIRTTKIHKVLKAIIKLSSIPKEEDYNFKKRSSDLLTVWNSALANDGGDGAAAASEPPATNGETKTEAPAAEEEADKDVTKEPSSAPVEATDPGNDAVDEADVSKADVTMADTTEVEAKDEKPAEETVDTKAAETSEEVAA